MFACFPTHVFKRKWEVKYFSAEVSRQILHLLEVASVLHNELFLCNCFGGKNSPVLEQRGLALRRSFHRLLTSSDVPPLAIVHDVPPLAVVCVPAVLSCWACPASGVVQELGPALGSPAEC